MKNKRGITLVALIITIIVLLILAGVVISMTVGNDGIIGKAQGAVDAYKNAQEKEEQMLNAALDQMGGTTSAESSSGQAGNGTETGNANLKTCTISISNNGVITPSGITNMKSFMVSVDNKWVATTSDSTYKLTTETGKNVEVYIIAIDEDMNLYKSNIENYTFQGLYLYNGETTASEEIGEWKFDYVDNAAACTFANNGIYSGDLASGTANSAFANNKIDARNYNKIYAKVNFESAAGISNMTWIGMNLYSNKINSWSQTANPIASDLLYNQDFNNLEAGDYTLEIDISQINEFYLFLSSASVKATFKQVWME